MNGAVQSFLLSQVVYQSPILLVAALAIFLAFVFYRRAPLPASLTLAGASILILATIVPMVIQAGLFEARPVNLMKVIGVVGSCARAIGLTFLIAAIFVGRNPDERQGEIWKA